MPFKFTKGDAASEARMTVESLTAAIQSVRVQREKVTKPFDEQLVYFKKLLEQKQEERRAKTTR